MASAMHSKARRSLLFMVGILNWLGVLMEEIVCGWQESDVKGAALFIDSVGFRPLGRKDAERPHFQAFLESHRFNSYCRRRSRPGKITSLARQYFGRKRATLW